MFFSGNTAIHESLSRVLVFNVFKGVKAFLAGVTQG
jgi:hypothetical protein